MPSDASAFARSPSAPARPAASYVQAPSAYAPLTDRHAPAPQDATGASTGTANWSVALYVIGGICAGVGIYLATFTRINLLTGQTSSPYLGAGIPLALIGIAFVVTTRRTATRHMNR
jgi:hypothetical protein